MQPTTSLILLLHLLTLTSAALPKLPKPISLPKPAPKPPVQRPSLGELLDTAGKGAEGILSLINPSSTTKASTPATRTPTNNAPVRLTLASNWAAQPTGTAAASNNNNNNNAAMAASCPRAQVYLNYCSSWYGPNWDVNTAAYCLCQGPSKTRAQKLLVYVPTLFDDDAAACAKGYAADAKYYSQMAGQAKQVGNKELQAEYVKAYEETKGVMEVWEEAGRGFCASHKPVSGVSSVGKEYYLAASATATAPVRLGGRGEDGDGGVVMMPQATTLVTKTAVVVPQITVKAELPVVE